MNEYTTHEDHRGQYLLVRCAKGSFILDLADRDVLIGHEWNLYKGSTHWYAGYKKYENGKTRNAMLHRILMETPPELRVDHIDGNSLNNRRYNLRNCTHAQNSAHHHHGRRGKSGLLGVQETPAGTFNAKITLGVGKFNCIGTFATAKEAGLARDRAAFARWGEFARLNYPDELSPRE